MTEEQFLRSRSDDWDRFAAALSASKKKKDRLGFEFDQFPQLYRRVCQDLNHAQAARYSHAVVERLNRLVWDGHGLLYRYAPKKRSWAMTLAFDFPRAVRKLRRSVLIGFLLFYGIAFLALAYCLSKPNETRRLLGDSMAMNLEQMYDPSSEHFLKPREITRSADMFGFYIYNNIGIGFRTFAGGALAGVGSLFFLAINGLLLGAASAHIIALGFGDTFFPFIVTHSAFEMTALILFGVAGLRLGWALVSPGRFSRSEAIGLRAREALPLIYGSFLFLCIAAGIEAFWSSTNTPGWVKYLSGSVAWLTVVLFFLFGGRRRG